MTPEQLGISAQQYANIEQLTSYCEGLTVSDVKFDMVGYCGDADGFGVGPEQWGCGTTACFAGMGPEAGVGPFGYTDWASYVYNSFVCSESANAWLFGGNWYHTDNTLRGACARARLFLESGVPEDFDHELQDTWTQWEEGWQNDI